MTQLGRRIGFSLTTVILFFGCVSLALALLEKAGFINLNRKDDRPSYLPSNTFRETRKALQTWVAIEDEYMVRRRFRKKKPSKTVRIFLTGGSFVQGTPYVYQTSYIKRHPEAAILGYGGIGDWLLGELEARFPSLKFEVINAAANGQNSSCIVNIVDEITRYNPDFIFVATGNNEGYLPATNFNQDLHQWILYRAMKKALLVEPGLKERSYFTPQNPDDDKIRDHYQKNIRRIIQLSSVRGVPLFLATLPINLKWDSPFPEMNAHDPEGKDPFLVSGLSLQQEGKYLQAIEQYSKSSMQHLATKLMGECYEANGEYGKALDCYRISVELMPQNRMRPSLNDFLRSEGGSPGWTLIDLERAAEDLSPNRIPGSNLFIDYCHMNWRGYYRMSQVILADWLTQNLIHGKKSEPKAPPTMDEIIRRKGWEALYSVQ